MNEMSEENTAVLNYLTPLEDVDKIVSGLKEIEIDCGVLDLSGQYLNVMMKRARAQGVEHFILKNVCGQNLIGTGLEPGARISIYGLMGNHSCAFIDRLHINSYPTRFPSDVWCPGDAQVAIGTSANPVELNVAGSVDDLFASYAPSGRFRVAGQGGNRCGLRTGAGIPEVWREVNYQRIECMDENERIEDMLHLYQKRRAKIHQQGWDNYIEGFKYELARRTPPVITFGRRVKDYFMEYAQGSIGVVFNFYDYDTPVGYYVCSGMTAGKAFIRGKVAESRLGARVKKVKLEDEDRTFLIAEMNDFYNCFAGVLQSDRYESNMEAALERSKKDPEKFTSEFVKIVPA